MTEAEKPRILDPAPVALYRLALARWGVRAQVMVAIEECGELIVALAKADRKVNGSTEAQIATEMADVQIMLEQLRNAFPSVARIEKGERKRKLRRLAERLGEVVP